MKAHLFTLPLLLMTLMLAGLCACGKSGGGDTVRIGVIAELTGDIPAVGASCKNAAELAIEQVNEAGGLDLAGKAEKATEGHQKKKIELFIEDNAGKAEQSALAAQKLINQQDVLAIVGPNASRYAIPVTEIAETARVVMITPWSTNPKATLDARTGAPKKYVFRACFIDSFQGRVVARFAREQLKVAKAAVLYDVASDYNKGIAEFFKTAFTENGGQVVSFETYTTGDKDFTAQLTKIKNAAPDIVFLPNYYSEVPLQLQQAHRLGLNVPFLGSDSWGSADLLKLAGKECEGYYFSTHYAADAATPATKAFIAAYQKKYGNTPDDVAALTYDAFGLLLQAVKQAGQTGKVDRQSVRDALARLTNYQGVTGTMKFQEGSGDPIKSAVILKIVNGKFTWFADVNP